RAPAGRGKASVDDVGWPARRRRGCREQARARRVRGSGRADAQGNERAAAASGQQPGTGRTAPRTGAERHAIAVTITVRDDLYARRWADAGPCGRGGTAGLRLVTADIARTSEPTFGPSLRRRRACGDG